MHQLHQTKYTSQKCVNLNAIECKSMLFFSSCITQGHLESTKIIVSLLTGHMVHNLSFYENLQWRKLKSNDPYRPIKLSFISRSQNAYPGAKQHHLLKIFNMVMVQIVSFLYLTTNSTQLDWLVHGHKNLYHLSNSWLMSFLTFHFFPSSSWQQTYW